MSIAQDFLGGILTDLTVQKAQKDLLDQKSREIESKVIDYSLHLDKKVKNLDDDDNNNGDDKENDSDHDCSLEKLRELRLKKMKESIRAREERRAKGHGRYEEIEEEKFLSTVTGSYYCVVHFYLDRFERCKIIDKHLSKMAPQLEQTRFVKLNAEKAPFFVQKLQIRTLPTTVLFVNGVAVHHIVGFEELRGDSFPTRDLVALMNEHGVLKDKYIEGDNQAGASSGDESD